MKLPEFKREWLNLSDYKLGGIVLGQFIAANAESFGINPFDIPEEYGIRIVERIQQLPDEYEHTPENSALFLALRLAANGKFEMAGRRFRSFFDSGVKMLVVLDEAETGRRKQKKIAEKPRPKKKPTHRSMTINEMEEWRSKGHHFDEFIDSAIAGSIDGLDLNLGRVKYEMAWDNLESPRQFAETTLREWWTEAGKKQ